MANRRKPRHDAIDHQTAHEPRIRTSDALQVVLVASQIALVLIGACYTVETSKMRVSMEKQLNFMWEQSRMEAKPAIVPTVTRYVGRSQRSPIVSDAASASCESPEIEAEINNASQNNAHGMRVVFYDKASANFLISPRVEPVVPPGRSPHWGGGADCLSVPALLAELTYSYRTAPQFFAVHLQDEGTSFVAAIFWDDNGDLWLVRQTFEVDGNGAVQYYAARNKPSYMAVRYNSSTAE